MIEPAHHRIPEEDIPMYEQELGVPFGEQLRAYLLEYGHIDCGYIELLGIDADLEMHSGMVNHTKRMHQIDISTEDYIAIENEEGGNYIVVDKNDKVYHFIRYAKHPNIRPLYMKLDQFLIYRLGMLRSLD